MERNQIIISLLILSLFLIALIYSCKKNSAEVPVQPPPTITVTGIKPPNGKAGDTILVIGTNFNLNPGLDTVKFNGVIAQVIKATTDTLSVIVPPGNCTGVVAVNGVSGNGSAFTLLQATITSIKPPTGKAGDTIMVIGTNFNLNPLLDTIRFNGITAKVIKATKDTLYVIVPSGNSTGVVSVNGSSANGPVFTLTLTTITITNVYPFWGKQGDTILITGTNFNPNPAKDTVTINGVNATVLKASADSLDVIVPLTSSGPIMVNGISAPAPGFVYAPSVIVTTVAGRNPPPNTYEYLDGPASLALFSDPAGLCIDKQGNLFISENYLRAVRELSGGIVSTYAGSYTGPNIIGPQVTATLRQLWNGIAVDSQGSIYITEGIVTAEQGAYVRKISNGTVTTIGGTDSSWTSAESIYGGYLFITSGAPIVFDSKGNLYVGVAGAIKKITPSFELSTFAGKTPKWIPATTGPPPYTDAYWATYPGYQDGQDTAARFGDILGLAVDANDNIYATDMGCQCIRKITPSGLVSYFALGTRSYNPPIIGPGPFTYPVGICVDANGNVYATAGNSIVKITPAGVVTNFAGSNTPGFADGPPSTAQFNNPNAIAIDAHGNIYVSDPGNYQIRKIIFLQ